MAIPEEVDVANSDMPSLADEKDRNSKKRKSGEAPFLSFPRDLMPQFEEVRLVQLFVCSLKENSMVSVRPSQCLD